jgi:cytoskeletal protein CcmA (bactofilin family)
VSAAAPPAPAHLATTLTSPGPPGPAPAPPPAPLTGRAVDRGSVRHATLQVLEWEVDGASKVVGDARIGFGHLRGIATVGGRLEAVGLEVDGTLNVNGVAEVAHRLSLRGTGHFGAALHAGELTVDGRLETPTDLVVDGAADLAGHLDLRGGLRTGALTFRGSLLVVGDLLATGPLVGTLTGDGRAASVRAPTVEIRRPRELPWRRAPEFRTLRIEGEELRLEGVVAEFVQAERIHLGPGCRIARHEGRIVERHRSAVVGPSVRSDIPPGYSR